MLGSGQNYPSPSADQHNKGSLKDSSYYFYLLLCTYSVHFLFSFCTLYIIKALINISTALFNNE